MKEKEDSCSTGVGRWQKKRTYHSRDGIPSILVKITEQLLIVHG